MADNDLDLTKGDESRARKIADEGSERSKRVRSSGKEGEKKSTRSRTSPETDSGLKARLVEAFGRIADQREARGDEELAAAIKEDAEAMSRGLVSLTRSVTFLRSPLVLLLGFLEPVLAFWHVGGILGRRFIERRERIVTEQHQQEPAPGSVYAG